MLSNYFDDGGAGSPHHPAPGWTNPHIYFYIVMKLWSYLSKDCDYYSPSLKETLKEVVKMGMSDSQVWWHYFCSTLTNTELLPFPKSTVNWGDYIYHIYQYYIYRGFPGGITLLTKVHIIKAMVFPVIMYRCESWTIKKASAEQLMLSNCGAGNTESDRLPRDQTSQS